MACILQSTNSYLSKRQLKEKLKSYTMIWKRKVGKLPNIFCNRNRAFLAKDLECNLREGVIMNKTNLDLRRMYVWNIVLQI